MSTPRRQTGIVLWKCRGRPRGDRARYDLVHQPQRASALCPTTRHLLGKPVRETEAERPDLAPAGGRSLGASVPGDDHESHLERSHGILRTRARDRTIRAFGTDPIASRSLTVSAGGYLPLSGERPSSPAQRSSARQSPFPGHSPSLDARCRTARRAISHASCRRLTQSRCS